MTISHDAPIWRRQAARLRTVAQHCKDPALREKLAAIASEWMRRTLIPSSTAEAR
jgi:hypothetical protein